jgi:biotin carboxyl carrier protein
MKSKKDLVDGQLRSELASINDDDILNSISSPSAGKISLKVAPGVFVQKGDPVAEIVTGATSPFEIVLCSHKDAFVKDLHLASGSVNKGDLIVSLDTRIEDRQAEQLQKTLALLDVQAETYSDQQIASRRQPLELAHSVAIASNTYAGKTAAYYPLQMGPAINEEAGWRAHAVAAKPASDLQRTELSLTSFDFTVTQIRKRQTLLRGRVQAELDRVNALRGKSVVNSPVAGTVTLYVRKTDFIKKGMVLARITL